MRNRINLSRLGVLSASAEFRRDTRFIKRSGGMLSSMRPLHVRQCVVCVGFAFVVVSGLIIDFDCSLEVQLSEIQNSTV